MVDMVDVTMKCRGMTSRKGTAKLVQLFMTSSVSRIMRARDVISRATSRASYLSCSTGSHRFPEYDKFQIFQIGQLLAEIRPIL